VKVQYQRLVIILISLILVSISITLIVINSKDNFIFFYTPTELLAADHEINTKIRIGGYIKENSIIKNKNNIINFIVTDDINDVKVLYKGILPDLFKEKQGTVVEGILTKFDEIHADNVFAKHDENYMPASLQKELKKKKYWKKNY
tara:strand:+ start:476 stop:913 length:438 start_codon:yes stop_codon:yes gene_type:complete